VLGEYFTFSSIFGMLRPWSFCFASPMWGVGIDVFLPFLVCATVRVWPVFSADIFGFPLVTVAAAFFFPLRFHGLSSPRGRIGNTFFVRPGRFGQRPTPNGRLPGQFSGLFFLFLFFLSPVIFFPWISTWLSWALLIFTPSLLERIRTSHKTPQQPLLL